MRRVVPLTALALVMTGAPSLALAQSVPTPGETPLNALGFSADATAAATYDSNAARSDAQIAHARGLTVADELFQPSVDLGWVKPIDREAVFINGSVGYDFYQHNKILNRERINLDAGVRGQFRQCSATLSGNYQRRQNDLQDTTTVLVKDTLTDTSATVSASCQSQIGFSPFVTATQDWESNSTGAFFTSNYRTTSGNAGIAYSQPLIGQISLYGGYTKTQFPNRSIPGGGGGGQDDGYQVYTGGLRFDRKLGARIEGTVAFAYTSLKPNTGLTAPFHGATYQADISYRPTGRISTTLHASKATQPTPLANTAYNIQQLYSADVSYQIGARAGVKLGVSHSVEDLRGALLVTAFDITHETTNGVFISGTYTFNHRLTLVTDVRQENRRTNITGFDYNDTRATLTAKSSF